MLKIIAANRESKVEVGERDTVVVIAGNDAEQFTAFLALLGQLSTGTVAKLLSESHEIEFSPKAVADAAEIGYGIYSALKDSKKEPQYQGQFPVHPIESSMARAAAESAYREIASSKTTASNSNAKFGKAAAQG